MKLHLVFAALDPAIPRFALLAKATLVLLLVIAGVVWKLANPTSPAEKRTWGVPARLLFAALVISVALLSFTSLVSVWRYQVMHGWWLLAHMAASGVFVVAITLVALFLSGRLLEHAEVPTAVAYFMLLVASIVVMGTVLLSMYPLFGTDEMRWLIGVHRYAGLGVLSTTVLLALLIRFR